MYNYHITSFENDLQQKINFINYLLLNAYIIYNEK